ncbi:MAG: phosphomannomutase, partial [Solirubrobacteraceae bacterium]
MLVPTEIFKAYDIRGLHGEQIDADVAEEIGRAFVRVLAGLAGKPAGELRIGLGRDMRLSAPELAARYRTGMTAEGAHVLDAGMVGTEMLYFLVGSQGLDGGLMCTASHNPKPYTGAKLVREGAIALTGDEGIRDIHHAIADGLGAAPGGGSFEEVDVADDFRAAVLGFIDPGKVAPMKVVVDGGNGMAGPMVGPLLERLGLDLVTTYWTPDGDFPDHEPNPLLEENRRFIVDK